MKTYSSLLLFVAFTMGGVSANAQALYRLPLASNPGYSAWFDHDTSTSLLRYDCNTTFQYNDHHGTDFACSTGTNVFAGATGTIYFTTNGCPDGSSPTCGGGYGNHIRLQATRDGRVSIYAHLESGTLTSLTSVGCGFLIAQSGASGDATGPHLHFELWQNTSIGTRLDFFGGACNSPSFWVNQNGGFPTTTCQ
ncbi:MAG: M23 family metallopeptidase [Acidobacteriia bacterium]|nr:M23 family metallopeptidase [Terriglobia bacterium]